MGGGGTVADWAALGSMLDQAGDAAAPVPKPSYGSDAPVRYKGPTPGMIGPPAARAPAARGTKPKPDPSAIWDAAEVGDEPDEIDDGRPQPEYDIVYKQNVSSEDMFLGIDPLRHAGVSCSDALSLRVRLPGCKLADLDLDVRPTYVRLQAPRYKLKAYLPATVDEKRGKATWDKEAETLTVSLPVVPALDGRIVTSASDELD